MFSSDEADFQPVGILGNDAARPKRANGAPQQISGARKTPHERRKVSFDNDMGSVSTLCTQEDPSDQQSVNIESASHRVSIDSEGKPPLKHAQTFMKRVAAFHLSDANMVAPKSLREKIFSLLEPGMPTWSDESATMQTILSLVLLLVIVTSVVCFCIETLPSYQNNIALIYAEGVCVIIFSIELFLRIACCDDLKGFFKDLLNVIDLVSILPWYVTQLIRLASSSSSTGVSTLTVFRVIRLVRVFRVLKLSKYSVNLQLVAIAVARSLDALSLLLFLIAICLLLFSSAAFLADQTVAHYDEENKVWRYNSSAGEVDAPFQSIPHAFWWCIVTLTTVGYGDEYPISFLGKIIASFTMLCGILVAAFPVILIGNNFNEAVEEHRRRQKQHAELLQRVLGQDGPPGEDDPPDAYRCELEIRAHLDRLRGELENELGRAGMHIRLTGGRPDAMQGLDIGTACTSFSVDSHSYVVVLFSHGNQPLALACEDESPRHKVHRNRQALLHAPLKVLIRRFNKKHRELTKRQDSKDKASVMFQFRYEPLFLISSLMQYSDDNLWFIKVEVALDSTEVQRKALDALLATEKYPKIKASNVCARQLRQVSGTVPELDVLLPEIQVQCKHMRPGNTFVMTLLAPTDRSLQQLVAILPCLNLNIQFQYMHQIDTFGPINGTKTLSMMSRLASARSIRRLSTNTASYSDERVISRQSSRMSYRIDM